MVPSYWIVFICIALIAVIATCVSHKRYKHREQRIIINNLLPAIEHEQATSKLLIKEEQPHVHLINKLTREYATTHNPKVLISIGDFYRKGMYPVMKSNMPEALKYYNKAAETKHKEVVDIAQSKIADVGVDIILDVDDQGEVLLPDNYEDVPIDIAPPANDHPMFLNDLQNVHDHYLNKITKSNIDKLKQLAYSLDPMVKETLIDELVNDNDINARDKAIIVTVINAFGNETQFDCTEIESLQLVYAFIHSHSDRTNLLHNLFLQLLDCMEHNIIVCTTGKISRVVSVVSHLEDFEDTKNIYYIKTELEQLAGKVRDDVLHTLTPEQVDAYNTNGPGSNEIVATMRHKYMDTIMEEYCNKLRIEYSIIRPHVETNIEMF